MDPVTTFNDISEPPSDEAAYAAWLELGDAFAFIRQNCDDDEFIVYGANSGSFMYAILVPADLLVTPNYEDLAHWNCNPTASWGVAMTMADPPKVWLSPPLDHTGSHTLNSGEQIMFIRRFEGLHGEKSYIEILQKLTQVLDIHFVDERHAYCRLDRFGDLQDIVRICGFSAIPITHSPLKPITCSPAIPISVLV